MNEMNITNAQYIVPIDETENTMIRATIDGVELYVPLELSRQPPLRRNYASGRSRYIDNR